MYKPISTYTGRHFDPYHAVAADLDVRDIAHAQSLMTRANGHFPAFYSVGQHSLAAFVGITSPVKCSGSGSSIRHQLCERNARTYALYAVAKYSGQREI